MINISKISATNLFPKKVISYCDKITCSMASEALPEIIFHSSNLEIYLELYVRKKEINYGSFCLSWQLQI